MGILRTNTLSGIGTDGPVFDGVTRLDTFGYVVPPVGVTSDRTLVGVTTAQGSIRFNTDSQKLEFFAQDQWFEMVIDTPNLGRGADTGAGARGLWAGGDLAPTGANNTIDYINISSAGNAIDFGDLAINAVFGHMTCASSTRGIVAGGAPGPAANINVIQYITISSTGNSQDFGDLTVTSYQGAGLSNATRGVFYSGVGDPSLPNTIDYITIASTGNAADFGDAIASATRQYPGSCASPTRGIFAGGGFPSYINQIEYITIATTGNSIDFGDLTSARIGAGGCSNAIRGVFGPGNPGGGTQMDYITIATLGNAVNFGNLITSGSPGENACCSSPTRGIFGNRTPNNTIEYILLLTQGNSVDFGDLTNARAGTSGCSNAHGGL
jgi:hypothetical protein